MKGQFFHIPEDVAATPADGEVLTDRWWSIHPEKGLAFYFVPSGYYRSDEPSPQCNSSRHVAERLTAQLNPDHAVKQVPVVFLRHAQREMRRLKAASKGAPA